MYDGSFPAGYAAPDVRGLTAGRLPPASLSPLTADEYAAMAAALRTGRIGLSDDLLARFPLQLAGTTGLGHAVERLAAYVVPVRHALELVFDEALGDLPWSREESRRLHLTYLERNSKPSPICADGFAAHATRVELVSHAAFERLFVAGPVRGWQAFYARHPDAAGYVRFARPAVDGDVALVHFDYGCWYLGRSVGLYVLLRRAAGARWRSVAEYADFVA